MLEVRQVESKKLIVLELTSKLSGGSNNLVQAVILSVAKNLNTVPVRVPDSSLRSEWQFFRTTLRI